MNIQTKLVLSAFGVFGIAKGVQYVQAQGAAGAANANPSQATTAQNPSQTTPAQNPSQTLSGQPSVNPNVPLLGTPNAPQAQRKSSDRELTTDVRSAITQTPIASNGNPAFPAAGISVTDLKITTLGGKMILDGIVHSQKDKADAGARAATVVGAENVENKLIVQ